MAELLFATSELIINTLESPAAEKIGLLWGVKDEIESLTNTLSTIKDVLLDAEEKQAAGNPAVTRWLGWLEDAMYDADDLLDEISTEALRREVMTRDKKAKKVRIFFSKSNQLAYRIKMAHKIKAIKKRLDDIDVARERFNLKVRHVEKRVGGNRERDNTHSFVPEELVIGREVDKKRVIDGLLDSNIEENLSILPIVGIGGLGKTTLAQLIFNDNQIQAHFDLKMWVCVSNVFDVKIIVEKILESATNTKQPAVEMNTLMNYLKKEIEGKKYFLVLDDVWNDDHGKWCRLKEVLIMGCKRGSRIVVTTRNEIVARTIRQESVAGIIGTVGSYFLKGLDKEASWSLFKQKAFEKGQEPENSSIVALGKEIVQKCLGVPLAITTIGSLQGSKNPETEWLSFKNNELLKLSQNETDILPILKVSYDQLPSHLKHCFAYCSLYPKDYKINRSRLIQHWIAQGLVKSSDDQNRCLEEVGSEYFMDLLGRSFFQEAETDEFDDVIACKMHDLMRDLAQLVAGSLITTLDAKERNIDEKPRHVSVVGNDIDALSITTSLCKPSTRSMRTILFVTSHCICGEHLDWEAIFSSSKLLRVLDLQQTNLDLLPSSIGKLKHLRYLNLSWNSNLKQLPNSITRLQNLQTLALSYCQQLEELPRDIKKLVSLKNLEIDGCDGLTYMPHGLGQLINLQTLSKFVVHKDPLSRHSDWLKELNVLINNLRGRLCIEIPRQGKNVASECEATHLKQKRIMRQGKDVALECEAVHVKQKQHLHTLHLRCSIEGGVNVDDELLLEVLQPHPNLKQLRFQGNCGSRLPSWLLSLTNLVTLELDSCRECQYMPPLSQLPCLEVLSLFQMDAMEYISDSNELSSSSSAPVAFFPSLFQIILNNCPNLKGWWRRDSSVEVNSDSHNSVEITEHPLLPFFPRLSTLSISNCHMLTSMPMFPHLEELYLAYASMKPLQKTMMMNMAAPQSPTSTAIASSSFTPLSKLKSIQLYSIVDLEILPEERLKNLTSLKSLRIWNCHRLKSLFPGIQHLTSLQDLNLYDCPKLELANDEEKMQWQGLKSRLSLHFALLPGLNM